MMTREKRFEMSKRIALAMGLPILNPEGFDVAHYGFTFVKTGPKYTSLFDPVESWDDVDATLRQLEAQKFSMAKNASGNGFICVIVSKDGAEFRGVALSPEDAALIALAGWADFEIGRPTIGSKRIANEMLYEYLDGFARFYREYGPERLWPEGAKQDLADFLARHKIEEKED